MKYAARRSFPVSCGGRPKHSGEGGQSLPYRIVQRRSGGSYEVVLPLRLSDWFFPAPFSAEPAAIDFTSGLRHCFLVTCDLLRAQIWVSLKPNRLCLATHCSAQLPIRLNESPLREILKKRLEFGRALVGSDFIFLEQCIP